MKVTYERTERVTINLPDDRLPQAQDFESGEHEYSEWSLLRTGKATRAKRAARPAQIAERPRRKRGRPRKGEAR